jgi:hypothetical protein
MAPPKTEKETGNPMDWLRTREDIAEAADRWAKKYVAVHKPSKPEEIVDALAEAFEAGAAEVRRINGKARQVL